MASLDNREPELSEVINLLIERRLINVNVSVPAKVVKYNPSTQYGDVQIQLLKRFQDLTTQPHPVIPNIPFKQLRADGGKMRIHVPVKANDDVMLIFSQRSLDNWKVKNPVGGVDTKDDRKFHLTDAYALIGGSSIADAFTPKYPTAIEIAYNGGLLAIFPDGKFKVEAGGQDLIVQLQRFASTLASDTVNTIFGPTKLNAFAIYQDIANKLALFKE